MDELKPSEVLKCMQLCGNALTCTTDDHECAYGDEGCMDCVDRLDADIQTLVDAGDNLIIRRAAPENKQNWIPVSERLPEPEKRVLVCAETRCTDGKTYRHITVGMYENGKIWRENSSWNFNNLDDMDCYDEKKDDYKIPEGWWEYTIYNDEEGNYPIDDFVTHWMPLPQPPKEVAP